jgi:hypothetical protein
MTDQTIHYVTVQTRPPRGDDLGQIEEGWYRVEGDAVVLVTRTGAQRYDRKGKAIKCVICPGETARAVAWRLTKTNMPNRNAGFNRPLRYFNHGKI